MWLSDLFSTRRTDRFQVLLTQQTELLVQAASTFKRYLDEGKPELSDDVDRLELQGDDLVIQLTTALRDTFITPIDRQDVYNLSEAIDDMLDYINNAAREIKEFSVRPTPAIQDMAQILLGAMREINVAVGSLQTDPQKAWDCARLAEQAENEVEACYRSALAELFKGTDVGEIFKTREIYRHLSNCADRVDDTGRLIGKIVVKAT